MSRIFESLLGRKAHVLLQVNAGEVGTYDAQIFLSNPPTGLLPERFSYYAY